MTKDSSSLPASVAGRRVRWWPVLLVLVLALLSYAGLWFVPHRSQQHFNMNVGRILVCSAIALLLWLLLLSRLRWRVRLIILGFIVGTLSLTAGLFRVHGVTGNLVPILEPRWSRRQWRPPTVAGADSANAAIPGAADFPQFLGPNRNGTLAGPRLATNWTAKPPRLLWRQPLGAAWSGFAVAGAFAITQEQRGEEECVVAYDLSTGRALWSHADQTRYFTTLAGEGPRATPAIAGRRVFSQGATGLLNCLDLATGRVLWSNDIFKDSQGQVPAWGHSGSPLVFDELVVVSGGENNKHSLLGYRVSDGSLVWSGGTRQASYSSPTVATLSGAKQIVLFADGLVGHDATTGRPLWLFPWPGGHPHVAMPLIVNDSDLIVSSGYGTGSARVSVQRDVAGTWSVKQVWRSHRLKAKFTNPVLHRGHVYGLDDGIMVCLEIEAGLLKWKEGKYGHGQALLVGQLLLVMAENGDVILIDPQPDQLRELTRLPALSGKTWNPPALAGEYLIVRNDKEAACFRLPVMEIASYLSKRTTNDE